MLTKTGHTWKRQFYRFERIIVGTIWPNKEFRQCKLPHQDLKQTKNWVTIKTFGAHSSLNQCFEQVELGRTSEQCQIPSML